VYVPFVKAPLPHVYVRMNESPVDEDVAVALSEVAVPAVPSALPTICHVEPEMDNVSLSSMNCASFAASASDSGTEPYKTFEESTYVPSRMVPPWACGAAAVVEGRLMTGAWLARVLHDAEPPSPATSGFDDEALQATARMGQEKRADRFAFMGAASEAFIA
jgi:hypothetical protein